MYKPEIAEINVVVTPLRIPNCVFERPRSISRLEKESFPEEE